MKETKHILVHLLQSEWVENYDEILLDCSL